MINAENQTVEKGTTVDLLKEVTAIDGSGNKVIPAYKVKKVDQKTGNETEIEDIIDNKLKTDEIGLYKVVYSVKCACVKEVSKEITITVIDSKEQQDPGPNPGPNPSPNPGEEDNNDPIIKEEENNEEQEPGEKTKPDQNDKKDPTDADEDEDEDDFLDLGKLLSGGNKGGSGGSGGSIGGFRKVTTGDATPIGFLFTAMSSLLGTAFTKKKKRNKMTLISELSREV